MKHNSKKSSYKMNINEFSILTDKEFRKKYLEDKIERKGHTLTNRRL